MIKEKILNDLQINIRGREWRRWLDKVYNEVTDNVANTKGAGESTLEKVKRMGVPVLGSRRRGSRPARRAGSRSGPFCACMKPGIVPFCVTFINQCVHSSC